MNTLQYNVGSFRAAGLEARWTRTQRGAPIIVARDPNGRLEHQRKKWWYCDLNMFNAAKEVGIREAFDRETMLGDVFSI